MHGTDRVRKIMCFVDNDNIISHFYATCFSCRFVHQRLIGKDDEMSAGYCGTSGVVRTRIQFTTEFHHIFDVLNVTLEERTDQTTERRIYAREYHWINIRHDPVEEMRSHKPFSVVSLCWSSLRETHPPLRLWTNGSPYSLSSASVNRDISHWSTLLISVSALIRWYRDSKHDCVSGVKRDILRYLTRAQGDETQLIDILRLLNFADELGDLRMGSCTEEDLQRIGDCPVEVFGEIDWLFECELSSLVVWFSSVNRIHRRDFYVRHLWSEVLHHYRRRDWFEGK